MHAHNVTESWPKNSTEHTDALLVVLAVLVCARWLFLGIVVKFVSHDIPNIQSQDVLPVRIFLGDGTGIFWAQGCFYACNELAFQVLFSRVFVVGSGVKIEMSDINCNNVNNEFKYTSRRTRSTSSDDKCESTYLNSEPSLDNICLKTSWMRVFRKLVGPRARFSFLFSGSKRFRLRS